MSNPRVIKDTHKGIQLVELEDELMCSREIFLLESVTPESSANLFKQLRFLEEQDNTLPITLYINSPGGDVNSGLAVYDYIKSMKSPVNTVCMGLAASMGAILFLAGNERSMFEHTKIMIHDPSYAGDISNKKPDSIEKLFKSLTDTRNVICSIIADVCNKPLDDIFEITKEDSFFNAEESLEFGIATKIINK